MRQFEILGHNRDQNSIEFSLKSKVLRMDASTVELNFKITIAMTPPQCHLKKENLFLLFFS